MSLQKYVANLQMVRSEHENSENWLRTNRRSLLAKLETFFILQNFSLGEETDNSLSFQNRRLNTSIQVFFEVDRHVFLNVLLNGDSIGRVVVLYKNNPVQFIVEDGEKRTGIHYESITEAIDELFESL